MSLNTAALERLASLPTEARKTYLSSQPTLRAPSAVAALCDLANKEYRQSLQKATKIAEAALWLADTIGDLSSRGLAHRTCANIYADLAQTASAQSHYEAALNLFQQAGDDLQQAVTRSSALAVIFNALGPDVAADWEAKARDVFLAAKDDLRLARLENNLATVFYRQEDYQRAHEHWRQAHSQLQSIGEVRDQAIVLRNLAVCHISLNNPAEARHYYQRARTLASENHLTFLLHAIDYNIAYLFYLQGEHSKALELYQAARERCHEFGDPYHEALCSLDESDIYLELHLLQEAATVADAAWRQFTELLRPYEAAKAAFNLAIVDYRKGEPHRALARLAEAAAVFSRERNLLWPGQIELFRALLYTSEERHYEARRAAGLALRSFRDNGIVRRAVLAEIMLARLELAQGEADAALSRCRRALTQASSLQEPQSLFPALLLLGELLDLQGKPAAAIEALFRAEELLQELRKRQSSSHIRLYGAREVLDVYEHLVFLLSPHAEDKRQLARIFDLLERAKTRGLTDIPGFYTRAESAPRSVRSQLVDQVSALRNELEWLYRRLDHTELKADLSSPSHLQELQAQSREKEKELSRRLARLRADGVPETADFTETLVLTLDKAKARLKRRQAVVSYFIAHDIVSAFVLRKDDHFYQSVAVASTVRELQRQLWYHKSHSDHGEANPALRSVLERLFTELIEPIEHLLEDRDLIFIPDRLLYLIPFHALRTAGSYLIQQRRVAYLPNVSSLPPRRRKPSPQALPLLFLDGLADDRADFLSGEGTTRPVKRWSAVAGGSLTELRTLLRQPWASVHIAAPVLSRLDNVLFSGFEIGPDQLTFLEFQRSTVASSLLTIEGGSLVPGPQPPPSHDFGAPWRFLLSLGLSTLLLPGWPSASQAQRLLYSRFYREMDRGRTAGTAAALAMRASLEAGAPLEDWATLFLVGDPELTL